MPEQRIICHTPTPGKQPTSIHLWKFEVVREAILAVVPKEHPGVAAQDLPELVAQALSDDDLARLGSVPWYTTTVKLHMEFEGELQRLPKIKPQRVVRT